MSKPTIAPTQYKWGFHDIEAPVYKSPKGLSQEVVESISHYKSEPAWMRDFRLRALKIFLAKPMPIWGADLSAIDFNNIYYYIKPTEATMHSWDEVPDRIKATFDKLGIPAAEQKYLAGVGSQYDSENVYHNLRSSLSKQGVIFSDVETAVKEHPEIVRKYFATVIPPGDNKFAALNSAVWSGGSFIYVPPGVRVEQPLQTYFRINAKNMGQFERTLIIVDEGAFVHYIEGCFAAGTKIVANPSVKSIEHIRVGDKVLTHTGEYKRVYHIQRRKYTGNLYSIKIYGDSTFVLNVTKEHPFLSVKRKRPNERNSLWNTDWRTPDTLERRDYIAMPINKVVRARDTYPFIIRGQTSGARMGVMEYKTIYVPATAEFFRLAGYYLAEGSVNREYYLHLSFSVEEKEYIQDVKYLLNKVFGVAKFYEPVHKKNNGMSVVVASAKIARIFKNFGTSSGTKMILNWMTVAEPEKQKELIKGLFRGDGNYYKKSHKSGFKEMFRINTTSYTLARQVRDMLLRLGIVSFLNERDRSKEGRQTMYTIGISGEYMSLFGEIVGIPVAPSIHNHKRATMFFTDYDYAYFPIKEIKKAHVQDTEVFNFGVEGDESYTAEGLAVHNCSAPIYATSSLHTAVVEIIAKRGARVRYTTVQNWSNDVYNLVTKRAFAHEDSVVEWVDFNMGCLAGDSKVNVYGKGMVDIKNVNIGDEVYSVNLDCLIPVKKQVIAIKDSGIKPTYKLITMDYREIIATDNHPFLVLESGGIGRSSRYLRWRHLKDLKEGDYIAVSDGLPNDGVSHQIYFECNSIKPVKYNVHIPKETTQEFMWILGAYIGDGYFECDASGSERRLRRVYFAVPPQDRARKKLEMYLKKVFGIDFWRNKGICLTVGSSMLAQFIKELGFGGTAHTNRIPAWVYTLPLDQKLAFIEGYLDTDGSERYNKVKDGVQYGQLTFTSCNKNLLQDMKHLMLSCGLKPQKISTYIADRKLTRGRVVKEYITHFLTLNIREDLDSIRGKHIDRDNRIEFVKIREVVPDRQQRVYDLEIDGANNFIANGIVAHNSKITMKYPGVYLVGRGARADILSMAYAGKGQHLDAGGKAVHLASDTSSRVISKSVSHGGGRTSYRGLLRVARGARGVKSKVQCDALILDPASRSDTYPVMKIEEDDATIEHEATVSKIGEEQLFYLMSRGLSADEAALMIVNGFIEPLVKELPLEYAVEMNRMIALEMEGSVG